jgi:hypothetical protein
MQIYTRKGSIILDLGTKSWWVVSFTRRPPYTKGNSPQFPLETMLSRFQSQSRRCGEEENLLPLTQIEPRPSSPKHVAIPTEAIPTLAVVNKLHRKHFLRLKEPG